MIDHNYLVHVEKLIEAVNSDDCVTVSNLLSVGINPNCYLDSDKLTPLFFAVQSNAIRSAQLLLAAGADPYYECIYGESPLRKARQIMKLHGKSDLLSLLENYVFIQDINISV